MKQLTTYLFDKITGKHAMIATLVFLLFTATVLPLIASLSTEWIGVSDSIDTNFDFDINHIYAIANNYGPEGRNIYIILRWTFDVVWPLVYTGFLVSVTAYFVKRSECQFQRKLLYIPILAMSFDFLENILATIVMAIYPIEIDFFVYLLIGASFLKWAILGLAFVVPVLQLIRLLLYRISDNG